MNSTISKFDPEKGRALLADAEKWTAAEKKVQPMAKVVTGLREEFEALIARTPEVEVPYERTPEGERAAEFNRICDDAFNRPIDPTLIRTRAAFDKVVNWNGKFPGPAITGITGFGKTFAAWQSLRRLYVKESQTFVWFPVRRLMNQMERYEKNDCAEDFFRMNDLLRVWFVDDLDKINWDFESQAQMLFAFFDYVYRKRKPCIVTTNRDRAWWKAKMGDAFVRRLFDDAFVEVKF